MGASHAGLRLSVDYDKALRQWRQAKRQDAEADRAIQTVEEKLTQLMIERTVVLPSTDSDVLSEFVEQRASTERDITHCRQQWRETDESYQQLTAQRTLFQNEITALFSGAQIPQGSDAARLEKLKTCIAVHPQWQELQRTVTEVREAMRIASQPIKDAPCLLSLVETIDTRELKSKTVQLEAQVAERDALLRQITSIEKSIADAQAKTTLEHAPCGSRSGRGAFTGTL